MKIKYLLLIASLGIITASCYDMNLKPKGMLGEAELFGNEYGVKVYFARLYNMLPIEDFNYYTNNGYRANNYWEAGKNCLGNSSGEFVNYWNKVNNNGCGYWAYTELRLVNTFISKFPEYKDNFPVAVYNSLLGEAHFFRAFMYSGMVKRYGGVPIITEVQYPTDPPEVTMVFRDKEYDCWKFIYEDLKFAMDNMSATSELGRANKYAAAALMSRMMLYAGSVAKYTTHLGWENEEAVIKGLAGMSPSQANEFFQYSYDAGKFIENSGLYSLYTAKYPDKATNFASLFLDDNSKESIFIKMFNKNAANNTRLRHSYDGAGMCPAPDMAGTGSMSYPHLDAMKMYDFPDIVDADGKPVRFDQRSDIKKDMEPRMLGTMYFDGDELRGTVFSIQRGIYVTFPGLASDAQEGSVSAPINDEKNRIVGGRNATYQGVAVTGRHGFFDNEGGENNCLGGGFIRKYVDINLPKAESNLYNSGQSWIVFRLGEIYLNMAEACYELGRKTEAFDYIEKIRDRAGCKVTRPADNTALVNDHYGYPIEANLQFIRDERYRELYGENHWWWDLRRWRIVDRVLDNFLPRVLMCYYVYDEDKYIFLDEREKNNNMWRAEKRAHYEDIPSDQLTRNPNLNPRNPLR